MSDDTAMLGTAPRQRRDCGVTASKTALTAPGRWLHALLAEPDLDFDLRRRADTLLAPSQTQAVPANDGQSSDLMDDLREFLRQQS